MSKTNNVEDTNNWGMFQERFNKTAKESNALQLKGGVFEGCEQFVQQINLQGQVGDPMLPGSIIAWSQLTPFDKTPTYYKITVKDGKGAISSAVFDNANITVPIVQNLFTDGIDSTQDLLVTVQVSTSSPVAVEGDCENTFEGVIANPQSNPLISINTESTPGTLAVFVDGASAPTGSMVNLPDAAVGDEVYAKFTLRESASSGLLQITNITTSTGGSFPWNHRAPLPFLIPVAGSSTEWWLLMDTSTIGSTSCLVVITSDDPLTPSYSVNVNVNVV